MLPAGGERCPVELILFKFFVERRPLLQYAIAGSFYLISITRNRKLDDKHLVQTKPKAKNTKSNIVKRICKWYFPWSLKWEKQQTANIVRSHIAKVTGHRSVNFLNNYWMKPTRRATATLSYNIQTKLLKPQHWEKANIGRFRHHSNCGFTRPSMAALKESKLPPLFSSFKSRKKFLRESSQSWGSQEQTMINTH